MSLKVMGWWGSLPRAAPAGDWGRLWGRVAETSATLTARFVFCRDRAGTFALRGSPAGRWTVAPGQQCGEGAGGEGGSS